MLILRLAWLNLWDKHMTTGRINQVKKFQWPRKISGALSNSQVFCDILLGRMLWSSNNALHEKCRRKRCLGLQISQGWFCASHSAEILRYEAERDTRQLLFEAKRTIEKKFMKIWGRGDNKTLNSLRCHPWFGMRNIIKHINRCPDRSVWVFTLVNLEILHRIWSLKFSCKQLDFTTVVEKWRIVHQLLGSKLHMTLEYFRKDPQKVAFPRSSSVGGLSHKPLGYLVTPWPCHTVVPFTSGVPWTDCSGGNLIFFWLLALSYISTHILWPAYDECKCTRFNKVNTSKSVYL